MSELVPIGSNRAIVAHAPRLRERTPYDWRELLAHQLNVRAVEVALFEAYYDGEHPLQFATSKFREAFGASSARSPTTGARSSSTRPSSA
jgi:hypothetical protein